MGVAGLLLPIVPGIVFLTAGLAILSSRSAWARRILALSCLKNLTRKGLANFHNHLRGSPAKPEEVLLLPRLDLGSSPVRAPRATPDCSKDKEWISRF